MALVLKMQIDDKQEHQYIFSTGEEGTIELIPLSVVANGRYQAPEGKAYNLVSVEVPEIDLESLNITQSGTYTAPSGKAYDVVTVDIPEYILDALTATENGTYTPSSGHVYDRVVVNVPSEAPEIQTKSVTYTANGKYTVNKDAGFDGMSSVTVTVSVPGPNLQFKRLTYTRNGTATVTPDSGYDGLDEVEVNIAVPAPVPSLQTKSVSVTANGSQVITADTGYDGLEEVDLTVNVPTPAPNLQTKSVTVTANGSQVISADSGYDGLDVVNLLVNVPTGGGGGNVFETEFTLTAAEQVEIPIDYSGNGYPIAVAIFPAENYKNSNLQSLVRGGSVIYALGFKNRIEVAPTYTNDSSTDQFVKIVGYKSGQNQSANSGINELAYMCVPSDYTINPGTQYFTFYLTPSSLLVMGQAVTSGSHFGFPVGYKFKAIVVFSE